MESLKGKVNFVVRNGQFGPFGKLENLILAENIRESQFFQTAIGGMLSGLLTIDTTHFAELVGALSFEDGISCFLCCLFSNCIYFRNILRIWKILNIHSETLICSKTELI